MKRKKMIKKTSSKKEPSRANLLNTFWENIPYAVYFKNRKGRFILVNNVFALSVGMTPKQIIGKTDSDIFPAREAKKMSQSDFTVMETAKPVIDKIEKDPKRGVIDRYVSLTKIPRFSKNGKVEGLIGIVKDATKSIQFQHTQMSKTERMNREKMLKELQKGKSDFIAALSHELRTPMAIIVQLFLLIFDETAGPINDKQREILVKMRYNMDRFRRMIDGLLDLSVMEGEGFKLHYSLANLNDLLVDSKEFFVQKASEKNIQLSYSLPKEDVCIFVDGEKIDQVVSNLINNAIKFTKKGGRIQVEVKLLEDKVRVGVMDNGIGIAKSDISKVFGKFVQVSGDEETDKSGIGMGLAIVKDLIGRHDGETWVESKKGVGTKFYFTLPRFYTAHLPPRHTLSGIDKLLAKGLSVHVINIRIINHKEFVERVKTDSMRLLNDFEAVINMAIREFFRNFKMQIDDVIPDIEFGRYSIILPKIKEAEVSKFCIFLRTKMKEYLVKNKVDNVFVVLGISAFSSKEHLKKRDEKYPYITIREVYVGPEMRRYKRINYEGVVEVTLSNQESEVLSFVDLSRGGLCFMSPAGPEKFKIDDRLTVKFSLLKKMKTITAKARVAWLGKMPREKGSRKDRYKVGVEFYKIKPADQTVLNNELKLYYE